MTIDDEGLWPQWRQREQAGDAFDVVGTTPGRQTWHQLALKTEPGSGLDVDRPFERVVTSETGGKKGTKLARFDMIPPDVLWELAEHYGKGEAKYPSDPETGEANWQKGYAWSLSAAALQRHLFAWLSGEDYDEDGNHNLIAVIWHANALRWFQIHGRGTDDLQGRAA